MSILRDRDYWRVKHWDGEEVKFASEYFGKDKVAALTYAIGICERKIDRWQKRKQEYLDEIERLEEAEALNSR